MSDVTLEQLDHSASPPRDEPPYLRTCLRCDQPWPCPARLADVQAEGKEITAALVSDDARRVGVLVLIEKGVTVWSSTRRDAYDQALGGVVVEINDVVDRETGEISRHFTCLDPYGAGDVTVRRLAEAEVSPTGVEATANSRITGLIKRLAGEVHEMKGSYLDLHHADRIRWMGTLAELTNLTRWHN